MIFLSSLIIEYHISDTILDVKINVIALCRRCLKSFVKHIFDIFSPTDSAVGISIKIASIKEKVQCFVVSQNKIAYYSYMKFQRRVTDKTQPTFKASRLGMKSLKRLAVLVTSKELGGQVQMKRLLMLCVLQSEWADCMVSHLVFITQRDGDCVPSPTCQASSPCCRICPFQTPGERVHAQGEFRSSVVDSFCSAVTGQPSHHSSKAAT